MNIVKSDMRAWKGPISIPSGLESANGNFEPKVPVYGKVDILVSELLGSFGDNELSPECLDGAMRFLKREISLWNGVSSFDRMSFPSTS